MAASLTREVSGTGKVVRRDRRAAARRSGLLIGGLGVLTVAPLYFVIEGLQARGMSAAAIGMSSMGMDKMSVYWAFPVLQASGIAALIWAFVGVLLGLVVSSKRNQRSLLSRALADRIHRQISLLVLGLILVHAVATALDAMGDGFLAAFVPWQQSWAAAVFGYNLGIFALYLAVLVGPSYYLRRRIGPVRWRYLHRFALLVYVLSVWHTLLLGIDFSYYPCLRPLTWLAQIPLLVLFIRRLLLPAGRDAGGSTTTARVLAGIRYTLVAAAAAGCVAIALLVVTGHSDLPARVGHHTPMPVSASGPWLPYWLGVGATAAFAVVLAVHLWHVVGCSGRARAWHLGHVLMAIGMIVMFLPSNGMIIPAGAGLTIYLVAASVVGCFLVAEAVRHSRVGVLWLISCVDLAAMGYMFAMPSASTGWLTIIAVAWFLAQALGWASGALHTIGERGGYGGPIAAVGRREVAMPVAVVSSGAYDNGIRVSLTVMSLGMAYMFLAMQFGMRQLPAMPGMAGM